MHQATVLQLQMTPCMRADRPFTDSEVGFLRYIRQWGKKVVFLVNKVLALLPYLADQNLLLQTLCSQQVPER